MAMVPHERSLVNRMKGKPFVFLGVNCDHDNLEAVKQRIAEKQMKWRNWQNDTAEDERITTRYRVKAYPTIYLIDAKGVIRFYWPGLLPEKALDQKVDALVKEAEKK
jgi:hypothetical protein